jgi:hypothetical protein
LEAKAKQAKDFVDIASVEQRGCSAAVKLREQRVQRQGAASGIPSFRERPDFGAFWPSHGANGEP